MCIPGCTVSVVQSRSGPESDNRLSNNNTQHCLLEFFFFFFLCSLVIYDIRCDASFFDRVFCFVVGVCAARYLADVSKRSVQFPDWAPPRTRWRWRYIYTQAIGRHAAIQWNKIISEKMSVGKKNILIACRPTEYVI